MVVPGGMVETFYGLFAAYARQSGSGIEFDPASQDPGRW